MSEQEVDFSKRLVRPNVLTVRPYKPGKPIEEVQRELGLTDIVKLASNENPLGASKKAVEAIRRAADSVYLYPDGGSFRLKEAVAERLGAPLGNVLTGSGSCELIELIGKVLLAEGDEVIFAEPSFIMYRIVAAACNAKIVAVPLKDYGMDLDAMADAVTERTKVVYIANPNNPTGVLIGQAEIDRYEVLTGWPQYRHSEDVQQDIRSRGAAHRLRRWAFLACRCHRSHKAAVSCQSTCADCGGCGLLGRRTHQDDPGDE